MPPQFKFTKEEIIQAALDIVRENGIDGVTARHLAEKLQSSSKPIFSMFENMDELRSEIIKAARAVYNGYVEEGLKNEHAFKGVGLMYIMFAFREPKLFQLLFMSEQDEKKNSLGVLPMIDDNYEDILDSVKRVCGMDDDDAKNIYRHLWIYTHGIASLIATGVCSFTGEEIGIMISEVFLSLLKKHKEKEGESK